MISSITDEETSPHVYPDYCNLRCPDMVRHGEWLAGDESGQSKLVQGGGLCPAVVCYKLTKNNNNIRNQAS